MNRTTQAVSAFSVLALSLLLASPAQAQGAVQ